MINQDFEVLGGNFDVSKIRDLVVTSWGYGRTSVHSTVHSKTAIFFN